MKINEVESLSGVAKKNIRFYEEQGLLSPRRNQENGYRDYGEEEVRVLRKIRLMRKLDVPLEEIRQMLSGKHTLADGMRRHLVALEREQTNLMQSMELCRELEAQEIPLSQLDEKAILARMEQLEQGGTRFRDSGARDVRLRYIVPVLISVVTVALIGCLCGFILWAWLRDPHNAPPFWFVLIIVAMLIAVMGGTVLALSQRIREIQKGEIDDAKKY